MRRVEAILKLKESEKELEMKVKKLQWHKVSMEGWLIWLYGAL